MFNLIFCLLPGCSLKIVSSKYIYKTLNPSLYFLVFSLGSVFVQTRLVIKTKKNQNIVRKKAQFLMNTLSLKLFFLYTW